MGLSVSLRIFLVYFIRARVAGSQLDVRETDRSLENEIAGNVRNRRNHK